MKILLIHNIYQHAGGEDVVFESEAELLSQYNHSVERLLFDNKEIKTGIDKMLSGIRGFYNPGSARKLQEKIDQFKPDVIHVHNFVPLASPAVFFVARRNKIPVVATLHNYRLICPSATLFFNHKIYEKSAHKIFPLDAVLKGVYKNSRLQTAGLAAMTTFHNLAGTWRNKVDKFIVLTGFAKRKFKDSVLRVSEDQFVIKPNFVEDPGYVDVTRDNYFLYVGRLSPEKGVDTLLNAARLYDFKLTIIGDGPLREKVEACAKERTNIEYLGFQKKAVILEKLRHCKGLLVPSVCFEGCPMSILEAFATGTPVIGSRIGGIAEIIKHNFTGLHFETGDANDLVKKIKQLDDGELAKVLAVNSRSAYLEHYTPEKNYKLLIDIYNQAIKAAFV